MNLPILRLSFLSTAALALLALHVILAVRQGSVAASSSQAAPRIQHDDLSCIARGRFASVEARVQPAEGVRSLRIYFRSDRYPHHFYYVEMESEGGVYRAYLPLPDAETQVVHYYLEAVDSTFQAARTAEFQPEVIEEGECHRRDPALAVFTGNPGIVVVGAQAVPAGFLASGIAGAAGLGAGATVALAAAAASGASVGVLAASGGDDPAGAAEAPPRTTTVPSTSTVPASSTTSIPSGSGTTTSTVPAGGTSTVPAPATTTIPATTTASPTTTIPVTTSTVPSTTTAPPTTSSVPGPTTTTAPPALRACFTYRDLDPGAGCSLEFDASCSEGDISEYEWRFTDNPPATVTTTDVAVTYDWSSDPACGVPPGFGRLVRLTVHAADGGSDSTEQVVMVMYQRALRSRAGEVPVVLASKLTFPGPTTAVEAAILLNQAIRESTRASSPAVHRFVGKPGWNRLEGTLVADARGGGRWQFDLSGSDYFVRGSFEVESGVLLSRTDSILVFQMRGLAGEQVRFRFRMRGE